MFQLKVCIKNNFHLYVAHKRLTSELKTQTESEGVENVCLYKQKQESWDSNTHIKQIYFIPRVSKKTKQNKKPKNKEGHYIMIKG